MSVLTRDFVSGNYSSWQVLIGVLHLALVNLLTLARCGFYCRNTDKIGRAAKQEWSNPLVKLTGRPLSGKSDKEVRTPTVYYPSRHLQRWIRLKLAVCYKLNQVWQVYKSCRIRHGQTKFQSRTVWLMRTHQVGKHATCGGKWPQNTKTERAAWCCLPVAGVFEQMQSLLYFNSMLTSLTKVKVPSELLLQISTKVRKHPTLHASQALKKAPKYFDCKVWTFLTSFHTHGRLLVPFFLFFFKFLSRSAWRRKRGVKGDYRRPWRRRWNSVIRQSTVSCTLPTHTQVQKWFWLRIYLSD